MQFVPDFKLIADGKTYSDVVIPKVQEAIRLFEDPTETFELKNSLTIAKTPILPAEWIDNRNKVARDKLKTAASKRETTGIAIWEDVEKNPRRLTLEVQGLSPDWKVDARKGTIRRKVLRIQFERHENELRSLGPGEWVY